MNGGTGNMPGEDALKRTKGYDNVNRNAKALGQNEDSSSL